MAGSAGGRKGAAESRSPAEELPAELANHPRYQVLKLLGQGGMGSVYRAKHTKMDRIVALKVINARLLDNPKTVERFRREVKAAAKLDHPNIVQAHDADEAGGTHFLVMEFVKGTDLARYVEQKGPLPVPHACHCIRQAALGLEHAHQHGMVHRDIKPHNLMLESPAASAPGVFNVKVMDFGLARLAREGASSAGLTGENALMGTADYIAPEQAQDARTADIRSDIYSLGLSLFHLLVGRPPLEGANIPQKLAAHLTGQLPLADLPATVPASLRSVIAKMVEKEPADRYQTPRDVAQALLPFAKKLTTNDSLHVGASPQTETRDAAATLPAEPVRPKGVRKGKKQQRSLLPVWIGVGAVTLVLFIGVVVLVATRSIPPDKSQQANAKLPSPPPSVPEAKPTPQKQPDSLPPQFKNPLGMEFVIVPKGKSWLNGGGGKPGTKDVLIADAFYLGKCEVTQSEWGKVLGTRPSFFGNPESVKFIDGNAAAGAKWVLKNVPNEQLQQFPVENISWTDTQEYLAELNKRDKQNGWVYRLPTEIEWEYACRGGPMTDRLESSFHYYFDKPTNELGPELANFGHFYKDQDQLTPPLGKRKDDPAYADIGNDKRTCMVGCYKPNKLGLYDMHGNVAEWCDDRLLRIAAFGKQDEVYDHVLRGGGWDSPAAGCQAANRGGPGGIGGHKIGLRVGRFWVGDTAK